MDFPGDCKAHIHTSLVHPIKKRRLIFFGSKATLVFDDTLKWHQKLRIFKEPVIWKEYPEENNFCKGEDIPISEKEPLKEECLAFIAACNHKKTYLTDGKDGVRVIKVLQEAQCQLDDLYHSKRKDSLAISS